MEGLKSLLKSRKFWLAVFGVVQVVVLNFLAVDPKVWEAIAALVAVLIAGIAVEDFGGAGVKPEGDDIPF